MSKLTDPDFMLPLLCKVIPVLTIIVIALGIYLIRQIGAEYEPPEWD